jgi:oxygen-independent coproporphyrinogen-3 oxidase
MCHDRVDYPKFERQYQITFTDYFADALALLREHESDGLVELHENALVLLPQGHLLMRSVAMTFDAYLGEEQKGQFSRTV